MDTDVADKSAGEQTDPVVDALQVVEQAAECAAEGSRQLAEEARQVRAERMGGRSALAIMTSGRPRKVLQLAEETSVRLLGAGSVLRRALVKALAADGAGVAAIARLFEVSHQRISSLLKSSRPD